MADITRSPFIQQMFIDHSHHFSASVIFTTQSYFTNGAKTIRDNCTYKVFFKNPVDEQTLRNVSSQLTVKTPNFLNACFRNLDYYYKKDNYKYILVDGHPSSSMPDFRVRSRIFPGEGLDGRINPVAFLENPKRANHNL
jgi:hypothetical protein